MIPSALDYETKPFYNLTITVSDAGNLTAVREISINILDVNEAPVIQNLPDTVTIAEDVMGKIPVLTVITVDQDGDVINYSMSSNPSSAPFEINAAGWIHLHVDN